VADGQAELLELSHFVLEIALLQPEPIGEILGANMGVRREET
jgi:hypothetical protein